MVILPLQEPHLPEIKKIAEDSFPRVWPDKEFLFFLTNPNRCNYGLFQNLKLEAYVLCLLVQGELDVISIAVDKRNRRKGYAEILMRDILSKSEVDKAVLEVDTENSAAIAFYLKMGFLTQGVRKKYYEGKKDAYLMTLTK